jgi:transcriptional regulator with XRE-family HTH domain
LGPVCGYIALMQSLVPAQRVGLEIKVRMTRAGLKQADLAAVLGLSRAAVSRRLNGEIPFDVAELDLVAELLGTTSSALVEEEPA